MFPATQYILNIRQMFSVALLFLLCPSVIQATEPTLARLAFKVPPDRMTKFETVYQNKVLPFLKTRGFTPASQHGRATPDNIFSRLFEMQSGTEYAQKRQALDKDRAWRKLLIELGEEFGAGNVDQSSNRIREWLHLYSGSIKKEPIPANAGKTQVMGSGNGHWKNYDVTNGLSDASIECLFQDHEGNLWIGTQQGGVIRYNGNTWTTFSTDEGLEHPHVRTIIQDKNDHIWAGTGKGISRFDGTNWTTYTKEQGLWSNSVWSTATDKKGDLWIGQYSAIGRFDGKDLMTIAHARTSGGTLPITRVHASYADRDGNLWFGSTTGVFRYINGSWTHYTEKDGLTGNRVQSILQDKAGNFWFGIDRKGVSRFDGKTWTTFDKTNGLAGSHNALLSMMQDRKGDLWFACFGAGISRYNGKTWQTFDSTHGLTSRTVSDILQDKEGLFWFSTYDGLNRYDESFYTWKAQDGPPGEVISLLLDRTGKLWIGSFRGLGVYDGEHIQIYSTEEGLINRGITALYEDKDGNIWIGTWSGLMKYDGQNFIPFTHKSGFPQGYVTSIFQDQSGAMWISIMGTGFVKYKDDTFTSFGGPDGLEGVRTIAQDKQGTFWFAGRHAYRFDGKTVSRLFTEMSFDVFRGVLVDHENNIWFTTAQNGVICYNQKTIKHLTMKDGLGNNNFQERTQMFQDSKGHFWFSTGGGLTRYDGNTMQTITTLDGLESNFINAIAEDATGNIWIGTASGLTRYTQPPPVPPKVHIDAVVAGNRNTDVSKLEIPNTTELVTFELSSSHSFKTRPDAMVFRYRLKGYNQDWHNTLDKRVEYQNLPRGDYTFEVLAVDRDLVYSETPATLQLIVHLPYERYTLISLLSIAIVLVAFQTIRVIRRDRRLVITNDTLSNANDELFQVNTDLKRANDQITEQTERKSRFLSAISHELRTPLTAIKGYSDNLLEGIAGELTERQERGVSRIGTNSVHMLNLVNDLLDIARIEAGRVEVNPEVFDIHDLITACCDTVAPLAKPGVTLSHNIADNIGDANTDQGRVRQIIINLLSNALKFTEQGEVKVTAKITSHESRVTSQKTIALGEGGELETRDPGPETDVLILSVSDTGTGIPQEDLSTIFEEFKQVKGSDPEHKGTGLGLPITKGFAELLGGSINVESEVGKGSTFVVKIPNDYSK